MLDRVRGMFRPWSTVLEVCFDRYRPCPRYVSTVLDRVSRYVSTVLDRVRGMFRPCSRYVSAVPTVLEVCFDRSRPCLRYASTVLDRARGMF